MWTDGTTIKLRRISPNIPEPVSPSFNDLPTDILEFKNQINDAYDEIVHWKRNIFEVPTSKIGRDFVNELAVWLEHFNAGTIYQCLAVKAFIILPTLLLQKPSAKSKKSEHTALLQKKARTMAE